MVTSEASILRQSGNGLLFFLGQAYPAGLLRSPGGNGTPMGSFPPATGLPRGKVVTTWPEEQQMEPSLPNKGPPKVT